VRGNGYGLGSGTYACKLPSSCSPRCLSSATARAEAVSASMASRRSVTAPSCDAAPTLLPTPAAGAAPDATPDAAPGVGAEIDGDSSVAWRRARSDSSSRRSTSDATTTSAGVCRGARSKEGGVTGPARGNCARASQRAVALSMAVLDDGCGDMCCCALVFASAHLAGLVSGELDVLRHVVHRELVGEGAHAAARQRAEQRRLACAVAPDQPVPKGGRGGRLGEWGARSRGQQLPNLYKEVQTSKFRQRSKCTGMTTGTRCCCARK